MCGLGELGRSAGLTRLGAPRSSLDHCFQAARYPKSSHSGGQLPSCISGVPQKLSQLFLGLAREFRSFIGYQYTS
jgi:hypothetical protein